MDRIGDFILWASQAEALRKKFPQDQYKLTLVANEIWVSLLRGSIIFDEIIPIQAKRFNYPWLYRYRIARFIRQKGFGVAINPTYSREFYRSDALVRFSGATAAYGFKGDVSGSQPMLRYISNRYYTKLFEVEQNLMELEINASFISCLGINTKPLLAKLDIGDLSLPSDLVEGGYFIVAPGASSANRRWPIENFANIAEEFQVQHRIPGIICGDLSDRSLAIELNELLSIKLIDLTGRTDIRSLAKIISGARFLISNESGLAHIGAAMQTPTTVLLGGGHYGRFFPYAKLDVNPQVEAATFPMDCYGCNWHCRYTSSNKELVPCISKIEVEQVSRKLSLCLKKSSSNLMDYKPQ